VQLAQLRNWGLLLVCNLIWGWQFVIYKVVQQQSGPVFAALFPISIATILLIPTIRHQLGRPATPRGRMPVRDVLQFVLIGAFGQVVAQLFVVWGVRFTLASNAALLVLALPIMTAFMAYFILGERMTRLRWLSFALAVVGVLECSGLRWGSLNFASGKYLLGNSLFFLGLNGSAFYNCYSKKLLRRYSALEVLLYSYYVVIALMLPIALYTEPETFREIASFRPDVWLGFILLAVLQYFLAMLIFLSVLARLDATQVGISNYLITFFGILAAVVVLHEHLTKNSLVGGVLVLASTLLVTVYEGRERTMGRRNIGQRPVEVVEKSEQ
jgi:drug/metabolite transporter (DMT)-like permease